jgi:[acyl-carrier-protein] S-malonyltransferase
MGKDLAERFPAARAVFDEADDALGFSLSRLMWEGPEAELTLTHNAQPAILVHSLAVWTVLGPHLRPVLAAGHSLGEYTAYAVLGALALPDAVRLVRRRGDLMHDAGARRPGTMAAVVGLPGERVAEICEAVSTADAIVVAANFNAPDQTAISGDVQGVERAGVALRDAGARRVLPLAVSGAFHSPLMASAADGLAAALDTVAIGQPAAPVVANASAEPVRDAGSARRLLAEQLTAPVRWVASMRRAAALADGARFLEVGPGHVLTGLLKRSVPDAHATPLGTVADVDAFLAQGLA